MSTDPTGPAPPSEYAAKLARAAETVAGWLKHLIDPDAVVELRALGVHDGTKGKSVWAGTFLGTELRELATAGLQLSGNCHGVYYTLNPLRPDRHVRQAPRVRKVHGGDTAKDEHVAARRWVLVDVDPVKPPAHKDDSATDAEKARTLDVARRVQLYLREDGWPEPVLSDSGNGHHLLYRLAEPLPAASLPVPEGDPLRLALRKLADLFDGPDGTVDTSVFNPARIVKLPGTLACKGTPTAERPHRRAKVLEVPHA